MPQIDQVSVNDALHSGEARILGMMIGGVREDMGMMRDALNGINRSLAAFATLEQKHLDLAAGMQRAFTSIEKVDDRAQKRDDAMDMRMVDVERDMPQLRETRTWVIAGMAAGVGMMFMALVKLAVYDPIQLQRLMVGPPAYVQEHRSP